MTNERGILTFDCTGLKLITEWIGIRGHSLSAMRPTSASESSPTLSQRGSLFSRDSFMGQKSRKGSRSSPMRSSEKKVK